MPKTRGHPPQNEEIASAVSMRGNTFYRLALRELSRRRKVPIATLVRDAVDKAYGQELAPLAKFFEESGLFKVRKDS